MFHFNSLKDCKNNIIEIYIIYIYILTYLIEDMQSFIAEGPYFSGNVLMVKSNRGPGSDFNLLNLVAGNKPLFTVQVCNLFSVFFCKINYEL